MKPQQQLFNLFIERNYPHLVAEHPMKDMLHSAYLTVWGIRRPIIPTADNFNRLVERAYYKHLQNEICYRIKVIVPERLFWDTYDEVDEAYEESEGKPIADITEQESARLRAFLRSRFTPEEVIIFNLAISQHTLPEIADITGKKKIEVRKILNCITQTIRDEFQRK